MRIEWNGLHLYVDPVGEKYGIDFSKEPKADMIFLTHHHFDHMDLQSISDLAKTNTRVFVSRKCKESYDGLALEPCALHEVSGIKIYSVPAYNTSVEYLKHHPRSDECVGYVFSIDGTTIYVAGDTEDTDELLSLKNIDVAFLQINQPYTMTIDQAINAVEHIMPKILYPYHTGVNMDCTDVRTLVDRLLGSCDVRIRNMQ